jgi:integrase
MAYMPKGRGFGLMNINKNKLVFTRECGSSLRLPYPNDKLRSIIKKYNLHPITIHGLRHTHASLLFRAGANIKEVQERLGHSDIQMTMTIYTHVTDTLKEQTAQKFQKYLSYKIMGKVNNYYSRDRFVTESIYLE